MAASCTSTSGIAVPWHLSQHIHNQQQRREHGFPAAQSHAASAFTAVLYINSLPLSTHPAPDTVPGKQQNHCFALLSGASCCRPPHGGGLCQPVTASSILRQSAAVKAASHGRHPRAAAAHTAGHISSQQRQCSLLAPPLPGSVSLQTLTS